jgi:hypothetical protein
MSLFLTYKFIFLFCFFIKIPLRTIATNASACSRWHLFLYMTYISTTSILNPKAYIFLLKKLNQAKFDQSFRTIYHQI